jgi:uncharacterized protein YfaS (alpha-2-macroglobulin family)
MADAITGGLNEVIDPYEGFSYTYGSALRDQAMILETLSLLGRKEEAVPMVLDMSGKMSSMSWYSTQTTAWCLIALASFSDDKTSADQMFGFDLALDDTGEQAHIGVSKPLHTISLEPADKLEMKALITNTNEHDIYLVANMSGIPFEDQGEETENHMQMVVRYLDLNNNEISPERLEQGTDFYAEVAIQNPGTMGNLKDLALTQIFPSGWEIINNRMAGETDGSHNQYIDYQDIRDDRVYSYFNLSRGNWTKFRVLLNAAYLGRFYLPPVACEAMYDNDVNARKSGQWVEVVLPGTSQ